MARQALAAQQRVLGPEHPDTLDSMANLSIGLLTLGQHEEAADMARQALAGAAACARARTPRHADEHGDLSNRLAELGQHEEAADMARQALVAQQRVLGPDHPTRCAAWPTSASAR